MEINTRLAALAAVIAGSVVLASCSSGDTVEAERTAEQTRAQATPQATAPTPDADGGDAAGGLLDLEGLEGLDGLEGLAGLEGLGDLGDFSMDVGEEVELPEGFPTEVPLIDGPVVAADHLSSGEFSIYSASINAQGEASAVEAQAVTLLTDAGFTPVDNPALAQGPDMEGFSMSMFEGGGDVSQVMLAVVNLSGLGVTMVTYSIDNSSWDF